MIDIPQPDPCRACGRATEYVVCQPDEMVPVCCDACSAKLGFGPPGVSQERLDELAAEGRRMSADLAARIAPMRDGVQPCARCATLAAQLAEAVGLLRSVRGYGMSELCEDREAVDEFLARVDGDGRAGG
jgi:hypothetical protein